MGLDIAIGHKKIRQLARVSIIIYYNQKMQLGCTTI